MTKYKITKSLKSWVWISCYYVWKIEWLNRIVLYEWIIKEDLWDEVKCTMVDQHIKANHTPFDIILQKDKINLIK